MNYNKENYIGKEIYGSFYCMVAGHEVVEVIIDVDDLGFTLKAIADLNTEWDPVSRKDIYIRRERPEKEQTIRFISHSNSRSSFTFLRKEEYKARGK